MTLNTQQAIAAELREFVKGLQAKNDLTNGVLTSTKDKKQVAIPVSSGRATNSRIVRSR